MTPCFAMSEASGEWTKDSMPAYNNNLLERRIETSEKVFYLVERALSRFCLL